MISLCFHVQNNAGECHRKSTFLYKICRNTTTSIKCCRGVTSDYPSCTIMSALLPLQRIAGVSLEITFFVQLCLIPQILLPLQSVTRDYLFLHNYVRTNTTSYSLSYTIMFAQILLHLQRIAEVSHEDTFLAQILLHISMYCIYKVSPEITFLLSWHLVPPAVCTCNGSLLSPPGEGEISCEAIRQLHLLHFAPPSH